MRPPVRSRWERALLVCGKCSRKVGGGFGPKGKTPLAKALRAELGVGKGREAPIGVTEVKCLGVCPKNAVTLVDTGDLGRWLLVQPGDDVAAVARALLRAPEVAPPPAKARRTVAKLVGATVVVVGEGGQPPA